MCTLANSNVFPHFLTCEMANFRREVDTILFQLRSSGWAALPSVVPVVEEYVQLKGAARLRNQNRRVGLQILFACRAIDSLLAAIVNNERAKKGQPVRPTTIGGSLAYIRRDTIGGRTFNGPTATDLHDLRRQRNDYLHQANLFPGDPDILIFLTRTIRAIGEAVTFPP